MYEDPDDLLEELSKYNGLILSLLEEKIRHNTFCLYKYHNEAYYNQVVALKKVLNIMRFLLK